MDIAKLSFAIYVIAGLLPGLLVIDLRIGIVHTKDVLEQRAEHVTVEENLALEAIIVDQHQDKGHCADTIGGHSQRIKLIELLEKSQSCENSKQDSSSLDTEAATARSRFPSHIF